MTKKNFSDGRPPMGGRPSLYSSRLQSFSSLESTLRGDQIFTGDQPDDFTIAGLLGEAPRVLMLGAGLGSGIRGIMAANPLADVTAVDNSSGQIAVLKSIFSEYFPEIKFSIIHADAQDLDEAIKPENQFDVICVDLYTGSDYATFVASERWWNTIRDSYLAPHGRVVANSWGLPTHLNPLKSNGIQASMYHSMRNSLGEVGVHSSRRNLTYISMASYPDRLFSHRLWNNLGELDQLWLKFIQIRLSHPYIPTHSVFSAQDNHQNDGRSSKKYLDLLMHHKWQEILDINMRAINTLQNDCDSDKFSENMFTALISIDKPARDLLPNQWSVIEVETGERPEIFIDLTRELGQRFSEFDRQWYVDVWLTQLISMALKASPAFKLSATYQNLIKTLQSEFSILETLIK